MVCLLNIAMVKSLVVVCFPALFLAVTIRERSFALLPRRTSKIFNSELLDLAFECGEQLFFLLVTLDFSVRFSLGLNSASTRFQSVFHV